MIIRNVLLTAVEGTSPSKTNGRVATLGGLGDVLHSPHSLPHIRR
jgi:hypothetical protein